MDRRLSVIGGGAPALHAQQQQRRQSRKSFGTALPANAAAASHIVTGLALSQLYQTVLKMSSENVSGGCNGGTST